MLRVVIDIFTFIFIIVVALAILVVLSPGRTNEINGGYTPRDDLQAAYKNYINIAHQINIIRKLPRSYEALNALERRLLHMENFGAAAADEQFTKELLSKKIVTSSTAAAAIIDKLNAPINTTIPNRPPVVYGSPPIIKYGEFKYTMSPERFKTLSAMGSLVDITICALKYAHSRGQQWSIPAAVYKVLHDQYGATIEGFASPLNSQMLMLGGQYCSLYDGDKIFGSLGNFFDYDLRGKTSVINPPFILDILNKAAEKCITAASDTESQTTMFIITPAWTDAEYFTTLSASKYLRARLDLLPAEYYFESNNMPIIANFASTIFVISSHLQEQEYDDILDAFAVNN